MANYYEILGVPSEASLPEIKVAYRRLSKEHHPDRGGEQAKFVEIQLAYECLSDPAKKSLYDESLATSKNASFDTSDEDERDEKYDHYYAPYINKHSSQGSRRTLSYEDSLFEYYLALTKGKGDFRLSKTKSGVYASARRGGLFASRIAKEDLAGEVKAQAQAGLSPDQISSNLLKLNWSVSLSWWMVYKETKSRVPLIPLMKQAKISYKIYSFKKAGGFLGASLPTACLLIISTLLMQAKVPSLKPSFPRELVNGLYLFVVCVPVVIKIALRIASAYPWGVVKSWLYTLLASASVFALGLYLSANGIFQHLGFGWLLANLIFFSWRMAISIERYRLWSQAAIYSLLLLSIAIYPVLP